MASTYTPEDIARLTAQVHAANVRAASFVKDVDGNRYRVRGGRAHLLFAMHDVSYELTDSACANFEIVPKRAEAN